MPLVYRVAAFGMAYHQCAVRFKQSGHGVYRLLLIMKVGEAAVADNPVEGGIAQRGLHDIGMKQEEHGQGIICLEAGNALFGLLHHPEGNVYGNHTSCFIQHIRKYGQQHAGARAHIQNGSTQVEWAVLPQSCEDAARVRR
jgi:hypothetical protein